MSSVDTHSAAPGLSSERDVGDRNDVETAIHSIVWHVRESPAASGGIDR